MPKPTSVGEQTPIRVVIVTLDGHLSGATERAARTLRKDLPGLHLSLHAASEWGEDTDALGRCLHDIEHGDIIIVTMLFMEDHIQAVLPALKARRETCDAMVGAMCAGEVVKLTKLGPFRMDAKQGGVGALLKKLRGSFKKKDDKGFDSGAGQMAMLRRIPQILRFIPGKAQDMRAYFLTLQYWLAGSEENMANLVRFMVDRYADGPRRVLRGQIKPEAPAEYPETGLYHPRLPGRMGTDVSRLPKPDGAIKGTVGVLVMRSYILAGNTAHYDAVIGALEARGLRVIPAFSSGLDSRPAIETFFVERERPVIDAMLSLTGFSLVGGPAYNDARAAEDLLSRLDLPYMTAMAVEFQSLDQWRGSDRGLLPVESTMMIAIPELDGATAPLLFGGRTDEAEGESARDMFPEPERVAALAARVDRLIRLRRTPKAERRVAIVLFNFPPNSGAVGTAAYLSVFESLFNTLKAMAAAGYRVEVPDSVDDLRERVLVGNAAQHGAQANVLTRISVDDHVKGQRWLNEIEAQWGPAPGRQQSDGQSIQVLGVQLGNVVVAVQPAFGYEGDPMRLLFEKGFTPTHAFAAFYRWISSLFGAHAVVHFGMHGALEFMPGKQTGLSGQCWPERLIGDLPNIYLYAANNPSEGAIAKRRSAATLVSYMTPPVSQSGLYKGLSDLKGSIERWRTLPPDDAAERARLIPLIQTEAAELDLAEAEPAWQDTLDAAGIDARMDTLRVALQELEDTLIPHGLHVVGRAPTLEERVDLLLALAEATREIELERAVIERLVETGDPKEALSRARYAAGLVDDEAAAKVGLDVALFEELLRIDGLLTTDSEIPALLHALDGGFIRPAPGGDLLRTPAVLPTGRNLHGFDPFRLPSAFAVKDGALQAKLVLDRHIAEGNTMPETIAIVLWGTDNLKTEGGPIGQALALMGARPRVDGYGRLSGAELIPLEDLGRPRVDVVMTLSGIFRDLLPLQTRLLAEAAFLAASAEDEPVEMNFIRKHAVEYMAAHGCDLETAALRVFSNADGAYGSNVNMLVDSGGWTEEDELAETYTRRKCFAYGRAGNPTQRAEQLGEILSGVDLAYQNLESMELGVTTVDHYFDTLGGISRAVSRARGDGSSVPVYIGDQTMGEGKVRTLAEQVALETRTRMLNPKWYESMLEHGYEGVRQIEAAITNTLGWSATTGQVAPWVYDQLTETFMLDEEMRKRLAELNPMASARVANRLLEAHERNYWSPDESVLETLRNAGEELEDRLEGVSEGVAA
ncbi:magnesium chelatase subunit H [Rhodospira trueperi]|uniref:magnesium chelatase n=1 Tax=Rhodospira trueperi TaxID=69960 RepID=A0A1G6ZYY2_9PROT|nr:magnesium chelatase subunit H [Rhodospira trueperi]SDE07045.1 magnesium chelatase subunit H [Rhodospira trueperi]